MRLMGLCPMPAAVSPSLLDDRSGPTSPPLLQLGGWRTHRIRAADEREGSIQMDAGGRQSPNDSKGF